MTAAIKTTAIFLKPFELASFNETLPAGEYEIEGVFTESGHGVDRANRTSCVLMHLHARASHPGLSRSLTVPLAELGLAAVKDKLTGAALADFVLEDKLSDPMIRLFMQADAVSEADVRRAYAERGRTRAGGDNPMPVSAPIAARINLDGMSPRSGSPRPGIGE